MKKNKQLFLTVLKAIFLGCVCFQSGFAQPQASQGKLDIRENFPSKFIQARGVAVWLPEGYDKNQKYPVLYMHDGQMLFDSTYTWNKQEWGVDEVASKLIADKKTLPFIVVGIYNISERRHSEYFPQKPFESLAKPYRDSLVQQARRNPNTALFATEVQSDKYLRFLVEELKPFIDQNYATRKDRANTFIAGSSMGGLISMYAICEYPDVFGGAACLSTHWVGTFTVQNNPIPDAFLNYLQAHLPSPKTHKIYFDFGTETLDALYEPFQQKADVIMQKMGYTDSSWKTIKFTGEDHSEKAWKKRLHIPLIFLLGSEK
ncbi:MAG: alpha/beta hydrolase-fold protein [Microscillaceae bacterium]|nr:alpha/beta hydrolase-fold protein [Microscillaceae bacterium]